MRRGRMPPTLAQSGFSGSCQRHCRSSPEGAGEVCASGNSTIPPGGGELEGTAALPGRVGLSDVRLPATVLGLIQGYHRIRQDTGACGDTIYLRRDPERSSSSYHFYLATGDAHCNHAISKASVTSVVRVHLRVKPMNDPLVGKVYSEGLALCSRLFRLEIRGLYRHGCNNGIC